MDLRYKQYKMITSFQSLSSTGVDWSSQDFLDLSFITRNKAKYCYSEFLTKFLTIILWAEGTKSLRPLIFLDYKWISSAGHMGINPYLLFEGVGGWMNRSSPHEQQVLITDLRPWPDTCIKWKGKNARSPPPPKKKNVLEPCLLYGTCSSSL